PTTGGLRRTSRHRASPRSAARSSAARRSTDLGLLASSCRTVECEAFDRSREVTEWHLFPDVLDQYVFTHNGDSLIFSKSEEILSELESYRCHMCACFRDFKLEYQAPGLSIISMLSYNSLMDVDPGQVYYQFDQGANQRSGINTYPAEDFFLTDETGGGTSINERITISRVEQATFNGQAYKDLALFTIEDGNSLTKIWVVKGKGLVGFEWNNQIWELD
ncbi:MAG: hypothetical protein AAF206_16075, partial [Bacteroidota bacterium]